MAVYTLTSGADAFTMRETRDGSLRKTAVWTHAETEGTDPAPSKSGLDHLTAVLVPVL